MYKLKKKHM